MKKLFLFILIAALFAASVSAVHSPEDTTKVWLENDEAVVMFDTFYIDGVSHMDLGWGDDGGANYRLTSHPVTITDENTITCRGWAGIRGDAKITVFGYKLNEGEAVYSEAFAREAEQGVLDLGGDSRYEIDIPVKGITEPTLITISAKGDDNKEYDLIEFSINGQYTVKEAEPEETVPDETEPDETEPDETEPDDTEPSETEPDVTEPDETEPEETERGDVNGDGDINNKDVVTLFRYVSGGKKAEDDFKYDYNNDGRTDNKDVVALFRFVSGNK